MVRRVLKKTAVTSVFPWTVPTAASVLARSERLAVRHCNQQFVSSGGTDDQLMPSDNDDPHGDELVVAAEVEVNETVTENFADDDNVGRAVDVCVQTDLSFAGFVTCASMSGFVVQVYVCQ
jgi:hypothetical protein